MYRRSEKRSGMMERKRVWGILRLCESNRTLLCVAGRQGKNKKAVMHIQHRVAVWTPPKCPPVRRSICDKRKDFDKGEIGDYRIMRLWFRSSL
jgi:hypothetical protein